jgi:glutathione S-transferase
MKLHWSPRSPFVRKVMIAAHELGLADRITCVRTVAATTRPHAELMEDNPLSKIPTLVLDDGTVLYDSPVSANTSTVCTRGASSSRRTARSA